MRRLARVVNHVSAAVSNSSPFDRVSVTFTWLTQRRIEEDVCAWLQQVAETNLFATREKYAQEREKRLRADGNTQYLNVSAP